MMVCFMSHRMCQSPWHSSK